MRCPECGSDKTGTINSRPRADGKRWRRYSCHSCGARFTTLEKIIRPGTEGTWPRERGNEKDGRGAL